MLERMEQTFEEIEQAALALPASEKSRLVDRLTESLADSSAADAWLRLAVSRLEGIRSGSRKTIDGPTGLELVRQRIRG